MWRLAILVVVALLSPTVASGQYTFGDWASDQGYSPGDVMPDTVLAEHSSIDSLDGISDFDWMTTPTEQLFFHDNRISSIESGAFSGLTNRCHWQLDVTFQEDQCRIRKGHADANFSVLRRTALSMLKNHHSRRVGIKNKRMIAALDEDYLTEVLLGK